MEDEGESHGLQQEIEEDDEQVTRICDALVADFDGASALIVSALENDGASPTSIVETLTETLRHADEWLPAETSERLESELVPHAVVHVLAKGEDATMDDESVDAIAEFLEFVLERVASRLLYCDACLLPSLVRILDEQRAFYENHTTNTLDCDSPFVDGVSGRASTLHLRTIKRWGEIGGFTLLLRCLQASAARPDGNDGPDDNNEAQAQEVSETVFPFDAIQCIYRAVYAVKDHVSHAFLIQFIAPLAQSSRIYVTSMSDSELATVARDKLLEIVQIVELVVAHAAAAEGDDDLEVESCSAVKEAELCALLLQLDLMLRFFTSSSLEKRIYGLGEMMTALAKATSTQTEFVAKWVRDNRIIEILFGEKKHPELIKRAAPVLRFVMTFGGGLLEWIDVMWACYAGKKVGVGGEATAIGSAGSQTHEVVRVTLHALMLEVIGFANCKSLEYVLSTIKSSGRPLDTDLIALLSALAARMDCLRDPVLMYMWLTLSDDSDTADGVVDPAIDEITSILAQDVDDSDPQKHNLVGEFVRLCVDNVEVAGSSLSVSLRLLEKLGNLVKERKECVEASTATKLVPSILTEMQRYKEESKNVAGEVRSETDVPEEYVHGIRERLLALRGCMLIAQISQAGMSTLDVLNRTWCACVNESHHADEAALFFQWIEYCFRTKLPEDVSGISRRLLDEDIAEMLVSTTFRSLQSDAMTMSALSCFHHLFRKVNILHNAVVVRTPDGEAVSESDDDERGGQAAESNCDFLTNEPTVALDGLWHFALHAEDQAVAEEAITLLARYHLDVVPSLRDSDIAHNRKREYIARCIGYLHQANEAQELSAPISAQASSLVNRCLDCLRYFLDANQHIAITADGAGSQEKIAPHNEGVDLAMQRLDKSAMENLEEKLRLLDTYPSPMKDSVQVATSPESRTPTMLYTGPRRPSWTFKQHHALLEAIQDDWDTEEPSASVSDEDEEHDDKLNEPRPSMRRGDLNIDIAPPERRPSIDTSIQGTLRPTQLTTSPSVQSRPNLQWFQGTQAPASRGPFFVIDRLALDSGKPGVVSSEDQLSVAQMLVNWPQFLRSLFDFVRWDDSTTSKRAWGLLCQLPISTDVLKRMVALRPEPNEDVAWSELLDGRCAYKLLYSLRLVESLLPTQSNDVGSSTVVKRQWRERFVRLGGAGHLVSTLATLRAHQDSNPISALCIGSVARVLGHFARLVQAPSEMVDLKSPYDSRLVRSTLPQFFSRTGPHLEQMLTLSESLSSATGVGSDSTHSPDLDAMSGYAIDMFCSLVPLDLSRAKTLLENCASHGMTGWLANVFSTSRSPATRAKAAKCISSIKYQADTSPFLASIVRGAIEAAYGSKNELVGVEMATLTVTLSTVLSDSPRLVSWIVESSVIPSLVSKIATSSVYSDVKSGFSHHLRVLAAVAMQSALIREAVLAVPVQSSSILEVLTSRLLWNTTSDGDCCDLETRQAAQDLLLSLCDDVTESRPDRVLLALTSLTKLYDTVEGRFTAMGRPWNFRPSDEMQDHTPGGTSFAGLGNPGCVCYMNSLVQQLFMMPKFRNGLLTFDSDCATSEWRNEMAELQKLFVSLASSHRKALDPTEFALSHRDMDGNPTDLNVQMDADEFFCLLLDRVETSQFSRDAAHTLASRPKTFLDECFGGVLVNQILTEQGNLSEREEKFFALSLDISQKQQLSESLSLYVQGETLDGDNAYYCEKAQKKVSATKRVCIKTLPHTLVCHLKRFEFDFDTMEKIKIHDYLAFPEEIDMFPYTSESFATGTSSGPPVSAMYDLVGIVVHSGSSDMGHYYSFIKDRAANESTDSSCWFEFNDQTVKPFDVSTMRDECFGGEEVTQKWDHNARAYMPAVQRKRRSAYMLIYEKRLGASEAAAPLTVDWGATPACVSQLRRQVRRENLELQHIVNVSAPDHASFLVKLLGRGMSSTPEGRPEEEEEDADPSLGMSRVSSADQLLNKIRDTGEIDVLSAVLACQHVFGVSNLLNADDEAAISSLLQSVEGWLAGETTARGVSNRLLFCKWLLRRVVETTAPSSSERPSVRRSWFLDVLFFCDKRLALVQGCCSVLQHCLQYLATHKNSSLEKRIATDFLRYAGELFYEREDVEIEDPASGSHFPVPQASIIHAVTLVGAFIKDCLGDGTNTTVRELFLTQSGFIDRFLFSFQDSNVSRSSSSSGMAPLTSRVRSCTFGLERQLLAEAFQSLVSIDECVLDDARLLLTQGVLKNMLMYEFDETLTLLLVHTVRHKMTRSQAEKLVSLLLAVLEEAKSTHLEPLLRVFGCLLDAEQADSDFPVVHPHILSPTSGLLEAAAYYRDHRTLHEYAFLLVEFVVTRAASSPQLQRFFRQDEDVVGHISWIKDWLGRYLDPHRTVRCSGVNGEGDNDDGKSGENEDEVGTDVGGKDSDPTLDKEVCRIFKQAERAFGLTLFELSPDAQQQQNNELASFAIESLEDSDGVCFSSDDENQVDAEFEFEEPKTKRPDSVLAVSARRLSLDRLQAAPEDDGLSATYVARAHMSSAA